MYFENMTSNDLLSYTNQLGVTVCENATNEDLISIIKKTLPTRVLLKNSMLWTIPEVYQII